MARTRSTRWLYARTLRWDFEGRGRLVVEVRLCRTRRWFAAPESSDPAWHALPWLVPGYVLAVAASFA